MDIQKPCKAVLLSLGLAAALRAGGVCCGGNELSVESPQPTPPAPRTPAFAGGDANSFDVENTSGQIWRLVPVGRDNAPMFCVQSGALPADRPVLLPPQTVVSLAFVDQGGKDTFVSHYQLTRAQDDDGVVVQFHFKRTANPYADLIAAQFMDPQFLPLKHRDHLRLSNERMQMVILPLVLAPMNVPVPEA